jgi:UDP-glucose 4-epimerase
MEKVFVTGAAGFIGSNLVDRLLADGKRVVGWDNFSTGQREFLQSATINPRFKLIEGDCLDLPALTRAMAGCGFIFHLAANADVRFGLEHPGKDLQQNTIATFNVLEAMRANGIKGIAFSSTGSVYGEAEIIPTPEDTPSTTFAKSVALRLTHRPTTFPNSPRASTMTVGRQFSPNGSKGAGSMRKTACSSSPSAVAIWGKISARILSARFNSQKKLARQSSALSAAMVVTRPGKRPHA